MFQARVAQVAEHLVCHQDVGGSTPFVGFVYEGL